MERSSEATRKNLVLFYIQSGAEVGNFSIAMTLAHACHPRYTMVLPYFWPFLSTIMLLYSGTLMELT